ncbi:hypothetical protein T06_16114 [Trichinella sp. T6]|nr:hypothetical protein T06_16114 [Trichinella sp. T6]
MAKQDFCDVFLFRNVKIAQHSGFRMTTCDQMTTIILSFWSRATCSQTCQNRRIAAVRFPLSLGKPLKIICRRSSILGSIAEA